MQKEDEVQRIQLTLDQAQAAIGKNEALERLRSNPDFIKVVMEGYGKEEAIRLVHAKASPALQEPEQQEKVVRDIDAIGSFFDFLRVIEHEANMSKKALNDYYEEVDAASAE